MTLSAAARRCGRAAGGPPSWKISSTDTRCFLILSSGMERHPYCFLIARMVIADDARLALQMKRRGDDKSLTHEFFGGPAAAAKGTIDLILAQSTDVSRHFVRAKIIVRLDIHGRHTRDGWMARQVDIIGDDGRRRIGSAGACRQHRHRIGNAEREAAS